VSTNLLLKKIFQPITQLVDLRFYWVHELGLKIKANPYSTIPIITTLVCDEIKKSNLSAS